MPTTRQEDTMTTPPCDPIQVTLTITAIPFTDAYDEHDLADVVRFMVLDETGLTTDDVDPSRFTIADVREGPSNDREVLASTHRALVEIASSLGGYLERGAR